MKLSFFKKYKQIKSEPEELKDIKRTLDPYIKKTFTDKLIESKELDKLIIKIHDIYQKISEKLFIKYDLKNELKQGKIFTILMAILVFLFLILVTVFFVIMLNSLLGINLIFQIFKYSIFLVKWGYTLLKSKGKVIKKYLSNLFPNNELLKKNNDLKIEGLPLFETYILSETDNIINSLKYIDSKNIIIKKEIIIELKNIIEELNLDNNEVLNDFKNLEYKTNLMKKLLNIKTKLEIVLTKQQEEKNFSEIKNNFYEKLNMECNELNKVYVKKK